MLIDHHLNWKEHIKFISGKLRTISYKFYRLSLIRRKVNLKIMYYAFAQSNLLYAILGWGGITKSNLKPLETVQKSILKTILKCSRNYPSEKVFSESMVCSIRNIFLKTLMLHTFNQNNYYTSVYPTRLTTSRFMNVPTMLTSLGQRQGAYLGPKIFNMLPSHILNINDYNTFKRELCTHIHSLPHNHWNSLFN